MTGNTPALEAFSTASDGTPRTLLADTKRGELTIQLSPADAASFTPGDFVLLFSNKGVDTESSPPHLKCAGEVKQITAADSTTGLLTIDDQIFDEYTQAQSAQVVRITMLQNITLSNFSVTTLASSSQLRAGVTHFRFVENLQIEHLEVHDTFFAGIHVQSVRNSAISGCYIHHINDIVPIDPPNPANERNGIVVGSASQNVTISRFSHTRHSVTTGGSSGKSQNGVVRNLVVANCTSMLADTAHFDTHQPAENVTFNGCAAIAGVPVGGFPATNVVVGFKCVAGTVPSSAVPWGVGETITIIYNTSAPATLVFTE
jgi:hypothetical protein